MYAPSYGITRRNESRVLSSDEMAAHGFRRSQMILHIFALNKGVIFVVFNFATASRGIVLITKECTGKFSDLNVNRRFQTLRGKEWTNFTSFDSKLEAVSEII